MTTLHARWRQFRASRRGTIAVIFAICLVPLVLLIGLAIDYSFFVQSSQQVTRAAEAAATQAVRTAAAGYALDIDKGDPVSTATSDAVTEGNTAGLEWFSTQAGRLTRGAAGTPTVNVTTSTGSDGGAGFTATVNYTYTYPPFFNTLFSRSSSWIYNNISSAQSVYQYVEVLLLLDTSGSMQIGASPSDIATISENSVCFPTAQVTDTQGDVPLIIAGFLQVYPYNDFSSQMTADDDLIDFSLLKNTSGIAEYEDPSGSPSDTSGTCNTPSGYGASISGAATSSPGTPCALACHTTTSTVGGYFADPYGMARREGATLRLDVVLQATEQVASDLYSAEQTSDQFSLGVYQFNNDVSTMVDGGSAAEATTDLTDAENTIKNTYDYKYAGNAAALPAVNPNSDPDTDFGLAVTHLLSGTTYNGTTVPALTPVTNTQTDPAGSTVANPVKNIFIVTDGLEDSNNATDFGEMTSYKQENAYTASGTIPTSSPAAYCAELKNLGFNVYVLYVTYYPLPMIAYYQAELGETPNAADSYDFGFSGGMFPREMTVATSAGETEGTNPDASVPATAGEVSPTEEALQSCATKGDFYIASSAADITTAMTAMLKSAINSSIQVTK